MRASGGVVEESRIAKQVKTREHEREAQNAHSKGGETAAAAGKGHRSSSSTTETGSTRAMESASEEQLRETRLRQGAK